MHIPLYLQRIARFLGDPVAVRHYHYALAPANPWNREYLAYTGDRLGRTVVELGDLGAPWHGPRQHRHFHAWQIKIDAEFLLAARLGERIQPRRRLADDGELL